MKRIPGRLLPHQIVVERFKGQGAYGDVYDPPETINRALVEDKNQRVRDSKGVEVVSSSTIYLEIPEVPIELGSMITRWQGTAYERKSRVIATQLFHHPRGLSHLVLNVA